MFFSMGKGVSCFETPCGGFKKLVCGTVCNIVETLFVAVCVSLCVSSRQMVLKQCSF